MNIDAYYDGYEMVGPEGCQEGPWLTAVDTTITSNALRSAGCDFDRDPEGDYGWLFQWWGRGIRKPRG